jgi:hypothetical protein
VYCIIRKTAATILLVIVFVKSYPQQDAAGELQKLYKAYNNGTVLRFTGSMKMYGKNEPLKILEKMQSSYTLKGKNFFCRIGPVEMMMNDLYYVSVDNSDKLMMIGNKKDLPNMQMPVLNIEQIKKWINDKKMHATASLKGSFGILELFDPSGITGYNKYTIEYDKQTGYMKKVLLETSAADENNLNTMVLEIIYSNPVAVETSANLFSEKTFFSIVNKNIQLARDYKGYQIINQL